ncbi:kinase [Sphingomonas sp. MMS12-HWE2-04]|uniref:kinase n=1 Tax=Sphingomonas sp. MMS12-HWE2-04 TaxID=3234199 RepID=UPI00384A6086
MPIDTPDLAGLILARLPAVTRRPLVLGIAGAQGSGKSTLAARIAKARSCPVLSLDDLYLDGTARQRLAETVHPLLRTRGVPGTHDVARGRAVIEALGDGPLALPRFDKARDEPGPDELVNPADLLVFEGWCLGARPQEEAALGTPVNALERDRDPDGIWRRYVDAQLAGPYRALFARIDMLVFLAAPGFEIVADWRVEQERNAGGPMTDDTVRGFVLHYQRITEDMLRSAPDWADITVRLDAQRRPIAIEERRAPEPG